MLKKLLHAIPGSQSLHTKSFTSGKALKKFAHKFDLVYLGSVDQRMDDHNVIRGITASSQHVDRHFIVGTVQGNDVSVVERQETLHYPGKSAATYTWVVVALPLHLQDAPHIVLDNGSYDDLFYKHLFTLLPNYHNAAAELVGHDQRFHQIFKAYAAADRQGDVVRILTPEIASMLAHHFSDFTYEITDNELYVYCSSRATDETLERMARVGLWLCEKLAQV